jgi:signal transduction histidine kinase
MKSEFLTVVSHELRTPLTVIKNTIDLLLGLRLGPINEQQTRFLRLAEKNIDQLVDRITEVLQLASPEPRARLSLEPFQIADVLGRLAARFMPRAREAGVALTFDVHPDLPVVRGDEAVMETALGHLLESVFAGGGAGDVIHVRVGRGIDDESGPDESAMVCGELTFNRPSHAAAGPGAQNTERPPDREEEAEGPDRFGLIIARELIAAHYGTLRMNPAARGEGRFAFSIPILDELEMFHRALEQEVERARQFQSPFSLVLVRLIHQAEHGARLGPHRFQNLLDTLRDAARRTVRRFTDRVVLLRDRAEVVAALLDTTRRGGRALAERLIGEMKQAATARGIDVQLNYGIAVFPEGGSTVKKLWQLAEERLGAHQPSTEACPQEDTPRVSVPIER